MGVQRSALHAQFGARLRDARVRRGMTQDDLAASSGLHRTYVGGVERGERNPSLANIARLAKAVGVSVGELTSGIEEAA